MLGFVARRFLYMIPTVILISIVTFAIIQLPPGDYLDTLAMGLKLDPELAAKIETEMRTG